MNIYLIILKFYASTRVVKNYSTPIWSRVLALLALLELLGTALQMNNYFATAPAKRFALHNCTTLVLQGSAVVRQQI